jgi:hypothetical protein
MCKSACLQSRPLDTRRAHLWATGVAEAEVALIDIGILVLRAALVRPTLATAVLEGIAPLPCARLAMDPVLLPPELVGPMARLQAARDTMFVAGAALVV